MNNYVKSTLHGILNIKAEAVNINRTEWLTIQFIDEEKEALNLTLFMPYETALAYASAINTVNDREAVEIESDAPHYDEDYNHRAD